MNFEIIASSRCGRDNASIVLCALPGNTVTPYVTWYMRDDGERFWGSYCYSLEEAADDYKERCKRYGCKFAA